MNEGIESTVHRLERMTRDEVRDIAPSALAIVPIASTEQHGPHLALGTDSFNLDSVLDGSLRLVTGRCVVVLPTLRYGSSHHHLPYAGTISLSTETYLAVLKDVLYSVVSAGFQRAFVLNGHGGNHEIAELAARDVARTEPIDIAAASWWAIARDELAQAGAPFVGHAGVLETAVLWATHPGLVRTPLRAHDPGIEIFAPVRGTRVERHGFWTDIDGVTESPVAASPELGADWIRVSAGAVANAIMAFDSFCPPRMVTGDPVPPDG